MEDKLNSKAYQTVSQRMLTEEATCALTMGQAEGYIITFIFIVLIYFYLSTLLT